MFVSSSTNFYELGAVNEMGGKTLFLADFFPVCFDFPSLHFLPLRLREKKYFLKGAFIVWPFFFRTTSLFERYELIAN